MKNWSPDNWQKKTYEQHFDYPSASAVTETQRRLAALPPLVTPLEVEYLKSQLAQASDGHAFLLQGGDCAESFADCAGDKIMNKMRILLQMSLILIHGMNKPVIRVGRIAGQYAKPRSSNDETRGDITLPSYRGDLINGTEFTPEARIPDPNRMLDGYCHAALSLNHIRALANDGFAGLYHSDDWNLDFAKHSKMSDEYHQIISHIQSALKFIRTIGGDSDTFKRVDFFTSHEALHLPYEQPLTHQFNNKWYCLSTHFPWIGMRTGQIDGAHIDYLRGIANPIAIKVSASATPEWLTEVVNTLNPNNEAGRLTLITRFGANHISAHLPGLIETMHKAKKTVLWSCDPMHGNTESTQEGYKTRNFDNILSELKQAFTLHQDNGSHLGGVHFELTGDNVTECIGGARGLAAADLKHAYQTLVDPRLNYEQALEMALLIVKTRKVI